MSRGQPGKLRSLPDDVSPARQALVTEMRLGYENANLTFDKLAVPTRSSRTSVHRWVNGQALPGLDQAQAWADACGTDRARMAELWQKAEEDSEPAPEPEPDPAPVRAPRSRLWKPAVAFAVATVVALLAVVVQFRSESPPPWSPKSPCEPYSARVTAPSTASATFDIAMDVHCLPAPGRVFWLFIRGDNIGDHGTTNYYPTFEMKPALGRQVTQNYVKPADPDGDRFYLVVSVAEKVSATLTNKREFVNRLPPSGEIASPSVRTVISHPRQPR